VLLVLMKRHPLLDSAVVGMLVVLVLALVLVLGKQCKSWLR
jgi:hypothetical protein